MKIDTERVGRGLIPVSPDALTHQESRRAPGYREAFLAVAEEHDGLFYVTEEEHRRIATEYRLDPREQPKTGRIVKVLAAKPPPPKKSTPSKPRQHGDYSDRERAWIDQFFNNQGGNLFEGSYDLWAAYQSELDAAGGDTCPVCVRNSLRKQYIERLLLLIRDE